MDWKLRALPRLALAFLLVLTACGGGSKRRGGSGNPVADPQPHAEAPKVTGRILLTDATAENLASFSVVVRGIRVELTTGKVLANMLREPVRVEILGLEDAPTWLLSTEFPGTNVQALVIEFDPLSYAARANDGSVVNVNALAHTLRAELVCPPELLTAPPDGAFGYRSDALETLMVDIDMLASVRGDVALGAIDFDPQGTTLPVPRSIDLRVEELDGLHRVLDEMAMEVRLEGFTDDERKASLGMLPIDIGPNTLLLNQDGTTLSPAAFFSALQPGLTISELHGLLPSRGVFKATRIEIEEQDRGVADTFPVKIAGRIVQKLDLPFPQIELQIQEIEKGSAFADPVLVGLGDPGTIMISLTEPDLLVLNKNQIMTTADLLIGQKVKVKFEAFSVPPFDAMRIDMPERDARVSGELFSVSGLPNSFVLHVKDGEPAITAGLVQSSLTDVIVNVGGANLVLDTLLHPQLSPDLLVNGTTVRINGFLTGPPDAPTIQARRVKVKAALLAGATVTSVTSPTGISVVGGEMLGSFGNDVTPGGVQWLFFEPESVFYGAAKSRTELFDVFNRLRPGQSLVVDVKGIGLGGVMEINAFQVHSHIVP